MVSYWYLVLKTEITVGPKIRVTFGFLWFHTSLGILGTTYEGFVIIIISFVWDKINILLYCTSSECEEKDKKLLYKNISED